jgi:hypothetical protein
MRWATVAAFHHFPELAQAAECIGVRGFAQTRAVSGVSDTTHARVTALLPLGASSSIYDRLWTADCGLWTVDCGLWTVDCGLWAVDCGLWTVDCGLWTVDCGLWTV